MGLSVKICEKYEYPIQYHDQIPEEWKKYFQFLTVKQLNEGDYLEDCIYRERVHTYSGFHHWYRRPLINWYTGMEYHRCKCETVKMPVPYNHLVNFSSTWGAYIPIEFDEIFFVADDAPPIGSLSHLIASLEKLRDLPIMSGNEEDDQWFHDRLGKLINEFKKAKENDMVVGWY